MDSQPTNSTCYFCNKEFTDMGEFWHHMNANNCDTTFQIPSLPNNSNNYNCSIIAASAQELSYVPSPYESPEIDSLRQIKLSSTNPPNVASDANHFIQQDLPPKSKPYQETLFQKPNNYLSQNPLPVSISQSKFQNQFENLGARPSKWSCTLCSMHFVEKKDLLAHVKTAEHEFKIANDSKSSTPLPSVGRGDARLNSAHALINAAPQKNIEPVSPAFPSATSFSVPNRAELVALIRNIFQDEFATMVKFEIVSIFKSLFLKFDSQSESCDLLPLNSTQKGSKQTVTYVRRSLTADPIEQRGGGYFCSACNCSITSYANLQMHCAGKRHKAVLEKSA